MHLLRDIVIPYWPVFPAVFVAVAWFVLRTKTFDIDREPYSFRKTCILELIG